MKLEPWFVTGLVDGEGSFSVSFSFRKKLRIGIETRPSFSISLNRRDLELIKSLHGFFGCGAVRFSKSDRTYKFEVRSISDLVKRVIPHFERYPLVGAKKNDFKHFKKICRMVKANLHLNRNGITEIIALAYEMNPSGKRKHRKEELLRELDKMKV